MYEHLMSSVYEIEVNIIVKTKDKEKCQCVLNAHQNNN